MPRIGGVFQLLAGSKGTPNTTIQSAPYNAALDDFAADANAARPVTAGGTGATNATAARTALGLTIGTNVQAYDALLQAIAALTTSTDKVIYTTGVDTVALATLTPFGRSLIDDVDAAAARTTLGVQAFDAGLASISGLTTAANQMIYTTGADVYATTALTPFARTLLDDAAASNARTTLGLAAVASSGDASDLTAGILANARIAGAYDGITTLGMTGMLTINNSTEAIRLIATNDTSDPYISFHKATLGRQGYLQHADGASGGFRIHNDVSDDALIVGYTNVSNADSLAYITAYNGAINTVWHSGNDGAGSGLDADTVDGKQASVFMEVADYTAADVLAKIKTVDGSGSGLDADTVDGYHATDLYRDNASFQTTGNLQISNAAPEIKMIDTTSGQYSGRMRVDANNLYFDSSTDDITFGEVFRFELDTKNGFANGSLIWTDANTTAARIIAELAYTPANAAISIVAGNGMTGGGTLAASRTLTMGTPGSITNSSTNSVTADSHTHALGFTAAEVYTGSTRDNTNFPIGTVLAVVGLANTERNAAVSVWLHSNLLDFSGVADGAQLSGTWRAKGRVSNNNYEVVRTA